MADKPALDELVAASFGGPSNGPRCWAKDVAGEAAEYVKAIEKAVAEGRLPRWTLVQKIMSEFGVRRGAMAMRRHFQGDCSCHR